MKKCEDCLRDDRCRKIGKCLREFSERCPDAMQRVVPNAAESDAPVTDEPPRSDERSELRLWIARRMKEGRRRLREAQSLPDTPGLVFGSIRGGLGALDALVQTGLVDKTARDVANDESDRITALEEEVRELRRLLLPLETE